MWNKDPASACEYPVAPGPFVKKTIQPQLLPPLSLTELFCHLCQNSVDYKCEGFFGGPQFYFIDWCICHYAGATLFCLL